MIFFYLYDIIKQNEIFANRKEKTMKKRILAFTLVLLSLVTVLAGCSAKLYDYDKYEQYIKLGATDGIEINQSDIDDGILNAFHSLYNTTTDKLTETTYNKETDDVYIKVGDTVNIDYVGKKDGVAFEGGTATGYSLVIGSNTFIDGFEDGLIGYKIGDKPNLNLTFPADYGNAELKGAAVVFEVKINSIKRTEYPEYNDENIQKKTEYKTVAEFEEATKKTVMNNLIWQEIYSDSKIISYPKSELKKYYEQGIDSIESQAAMFGMTLSSYVKQYYGGSDMKSFYASMASQAQSQVKQELIVLRFIEAKPEFKMDEEKYNAEVEKLYNEYVAEQNFTGSLKKFKKQYDRMSLEITIYYDIVIDYLREKCIIKDDVTKNGFVTDRNGIRYYEKGEFLKGWQNLDPDGDGTTALYYFDSNGYAPNNTNASVILQDATEAIYAVFGANGEYKGPYTGKVDEEKGTKYYKDGVMLKGLQELDLDTEIAGNEKYYFDEETGYMVKNGVAEIEGVYYEFGKNGVMVSENDGKANGIVIDAGTNGIRFFKDGALLTGWVRYYGENNAEAGSGYVESETDKYYYCDSTTGVAVNVATKIEDFYYAFNVETCVCEGLFTGAVGDKNIVNGVEQPATNPAE